MLRISLDNDKEYFADGSLSQSRIKALLSGMGTYKTLDPDSEEAEHFILGSAVDCKLLTPSTFDSLYYISTLEKKPSDLIMTILRYVHTRTIYSDILLNKKLIWKACNEKEYYMNRAKEFADDNRPLDIIKKGEEYWNELVASQGRTILDEHELNIIDLIVQGFKTHSHTKKYFEENDNLIVISQLDIFWTYQDVPCKALLDYVIIDKLNKTIQPIDIKTLGDSTKAFAKSARMRRYDIQAAWYTFAISQLDSVWLNTITEFKLDGYAVLPFKFIVDSTKHPGLCPLVYTCTEGDLSVGRYGYQSKSRVIETVGNKLDSPIEIKFGFEDGVNRYIWHTEQNDWTYDKHILENNGELPLQLWNI